MRRSAFGISLTYRNSLLSLFAVFTSLACSSGSTGSLGPDGGDGGDASAATDALTVKDAPLSDCAPACGAGQVCVRPGSCEFDARCVPRAEITCPDAGLCSTTGCAGELVADTLRCICR